MFARPLAGWLKGPEWIRNPLAVTVAAQFGAVPVMVATFGPVSVLSVPADLAAEPAAGLVMTSGLTAGLLAGVVQEEVAWLLQAPTRVAVWWVDTVAELASGLSVPPVGLLGWVAILAGCAIAIGAWKRRGAQVVGSTLLIGTLPAVMLLRPPMPASGDAPQLDGPAVLVACSGQWVVTVTENIDDRSGAEVTEALWRVGIARVAVVVARNDTPSASDLAARLDAVLIVFEGPSSDPLARGSPCSFGR